jgi:hypothetical protein
MAAALSREVRIMTRATAPVGGVVGTLASGFKC